MKVLVAEDDPTVRRILEVTLNKHGYDLILSNDGSKAWDILKKQDAPQLVILDWMMPGMDGIDICRKIRGRKNSHYIYIILLTAKDRIDDIAAGLDAGADDYMTKPFRNRELMARLRVGSRILDLQNKLADHVAKLEDALSKVKQLQGLLPICAYCKKIRDDRNYWQQVDRYITDHSEAQFSHSICPDCYDQYIKPELAEIQEGQES